MHSFIAELKCVFLNFTKIEAYLNVRLSLDSYNAHSSNALQLLLMPSRQVSHHVVSQLWINIDHTQLIFCHHYKFLSYHKCRNYSIMITAETLFFHHHMMRRHVKV